MAAGVVKIFFCLFLATLAEINESNVPTSTMSNAEIERFISTMQYSHNLTQEQENMIMNYWITQTNTMPTYAPRAFTPRRFDPDLERIMTSCEDVDKLVEEMDSNYSPTRHERDWIMKCLMPTLPPFATWPYTDVWPGFEGVTESANEDAEDFQPINDYPVQEHRPPVQEHRPPVQEHRPPVQENYDEEYSTYVGSSRGIAGYNYPNYFDIPQTSFTCMEKEIVPGFYADLETGCQVFHVCWPHRRESFLCPVGTIFNQALLACDFWYNSNCSMAPLYYNVNVDAYYQVPEESGAAVGSMIDTLIEKGQHGGSDRPVQTPPPRSDGKGTVAPDMSYIMKLLPIKAKVTVYPDSKGQQSKIVAEASVGRKKKITKPVVVTEKPVVLKPVVVTEKPVVPKPVVVTENPVVPKPVVVTENPVVPEYQYGSSVKFVQDQEVLKVVGEIFDAAKKIVEESRGRASLMKIKQMKLHKPKSLPLTKLNPRFITKPVLPEQVLRESVKQSKIIPQTEPKSTKVVKRIIYKPVIRASTLKKVSPITRKALAGSYSKLLKLKF